jgi:hypothetical protein
MEMEWKYVIYPRIILTGRSSTHLARNYVRYWSMEDDASTTTQSIVCGSQGI